MSLTSGMRIGPYEIVSPLGAGGMGEVYRARDTRLQREVALKVLPAEFAADPGRRQRFEREARAAAALNHPNILTLFDIGEEDGLAYLVTELVDGGSLRERLERAGGRLPLKETYRIAVQIADGLAAAHQARITHRDVKPENIMITGEGRVKILDFGLAQQKEAAASSDEKTLVAATLTQPGAVLGTANYMSPEQARGDAVDHRSDQFSFGLVLYEMITGKVPFRRETAVQTMSAILTDEVPALDPSTPLPLRWTVSRCLEKEAGARYESTRDLLFDLRNQQAHLSETSGHTGAVQAVAPTRAARPWRYALLAVPLLALGAAVGAIWGLATANPIENYKLTPIEVTRNARTGHWSPDGKALVYSGMVNRSYQVFLRYLDQPNPVQLTKSRYGIALGWTPDSKRVFFYAPNTQPKPAVALYSLSVNGGDPEYHIPLPHQPFLSPDGRAMATIQFDEKGSEWSIHYASPIGSALKPYPGFKTKLAISNAPNIMFARDLRRMILTWDVAGERQSWALPLPPGQDPPQQILKEKLAFSSGTPGGSLFPDGRHALLSATPTLQDSHYSLFTADLQNGGIRRLTAGMFTGRRPELSPDGRRAAVARGNGDNHLVRINLTNGVAERLASSAMQAGMPAWANGGRFVYVSNRNALPEVWMRATDGSEQPLLTSAQLPTGTKWLMTPAVSPDGARLCVVAVTDENRNALWISSLSAGRPVRLTNVAEPKEYGGSWSPDGSRFVYLVVRSGFGDLWVVKTTGEAPPTLLRSKVAGSLPEWSADGKWIKFRDPKEGWSLLSPNGKEVRSFGTLDGAIEVTLSQDGSQFHGLRFKDEKLFLFRFDLNTRKQTDISEVDRDNYPRSSLNPGVRLSLSPDGKAILYPAIESRFSLWMLEGFPQPSFWGRVQDLFLRR